MRWLIYQYILLLPLLHSKPAIAALDGCTYTYKSPGGMTGAPIKLNDQSCKILQGTAKAPKVSFKSLRAKDAPFVPRFVPQMVTGVSQLKKEVFVSHFYNWMEMLPPGMKFIVFDLNEEEDKEFFNELQAALNWDPDRLILRRFPFEDYPKHVRQLDTYAFKPLITDIIIREFGAALWLDTSIVLRYSPSKISDFIVYGEPVRWIEQTAISKDAKKRTRTEGCALYHAYKNSHTIAKYTHEAMMSFIPVDGGSNLSNTTAMMTAQYLIYNTAFCHKFLLMPMVACALAPECIVPENSTKTCDRSSQDGWNEDGTRCHRQDQSLTSLLFLNNCGPPPDGCTMQSQQYSISGLSELSILDRRERRKFSRPAPKWADYWRPLASVVTPLTVVVLSSSLALVIILLRLIRGSHRVSQYTPITAPT